MRSLLQIVASVCCLFTVSVQAEVSAFRMDQTRLWLSAENVSLHRLFEHFSAAGVRVEIDPLVQKTVSGSWQNAEMEAVFDTLLSPYDYLLDWQRETGPLGGFIRLTGIHIFSERGPAETKPLTPVRRIETSMNGRFRFVAREILVGFAPGSSMDDLRTFLERTGGTVIAVNLPLGVYRILLPEGTNVTDLAAQLVNDRRIVLAEPNYVYNLPETGGSAAGASIVGNWTPPPADSPMAVAVLDSGLLADGNLNRAVINSYDATNPDSPLISDAVGHGTLMAQLAAGLIDPGGKPVGEGVPVVAVKAFADDGTADSFTLMNAVTYAVANSSGPISLSWGSGTPSRFIESAMNYAADAGRLIFAAVGNENTGQPIYPAAYPGVIGVAASDGDRLAEYSNRGDFVQLIAPGTAGDSTGTSVATAYAAHVAALYMQHHPEATAVETAAALKKAVGPSGFLTEEAVRELTVR